MDKETVLVYIMGAAAVLQGALFLRFALSAGVRSTTDHALERGSKASRQSRIERADHNRERVSPLARYIVSLVGFGMAVALLTRLITPAAAYAILCLALVGRCVADQIVEERTPRRRSALIGRSRSIDPVLVMWMGLTGAASLALVPWLLNDAYRIAGGVVMVCVLTMVVVAWRIASAPPLLFGNDLEAEQVVDRETRAIRTGNVCVLTVGTVGAFVAFIGGQHGFFDHRFIVWAVMFLWAGLLAWKSIYARTFHKRPWHRDALASIRRSGFGHGALSTDRGSVT